MTARWAASPPRDRLAALVLAAGAGARLRPLTDHRPKALCPVDNVPLLDLALARARRHAAHLAVNVHHGRAAMLAHLAAIADVRVAVEQPVALGTAGAVGNLRPWIDGRGVLVANADAWHRDNLDTLVHGWDRERVRLLVVRDAAHSDFRGRWRYAGACLLPWRVAVTLDATPSGLYEVCWRAQETAGRLDLSPTACEFVDCGTPSRYLRANLLSSGGISVVGAGARADGELVRSVVWPAGVVRRGERLVDSIRVGTDVTVYAGVAPDAAG